MAKDKSSMSGDSYERKPLDYGVQKSTRPINTTPSRSDSKENAAGSPHPNPRGNMDEGRAGRQTLGSDELKVKKTQFNKIRVEADCM